MGGNMPFSGALEIDSTCSLMLTVGTCAISMSTSIASMCLTFPTDLCPPSRMHRIALEWQLWIDDLNIHHHGDLIMLSSWQRYYFKWNVRILELIVIETV